MISSPPSLALPSTGNTGLPGGRFPSTLGCSCPTQTALLCLQRKKIGGLVGTRPRACLKKRKGPAWELAFQSLVQTEPNVKFQFLSDNNAFFWKVDCPHTKNMSKPKFTLCPSRGRWVCTWGRGPRWLLLTAHSTCPLCIHSLTNSYVWPNPALYKSWDLSILKSWSCHGLSNSTEWEIRIFVIPCLGFHILNIQSNDIWWHRNLSGPGLCLCARNWDRTVTFMVPILMGRVKQMIKPIQTCLRTVKSVKKEKDRQSAIEVSPGDCI